MAKPWIFEQLPKKEDFQYYDLGTMTEAHEIDSFKDGLSVTLASHQSFPKLALMNPTVYTWAVVTVAMRGTEGWQLAIPSSSSFGVDADSVMIMRKGDVMNSWGTWQRVGSNQWADGRGAVNRKPVYYQNRGHFVELVNGPEFGQAGATGLCILESICPWTDTTGGVLQRMSFFGSDQVQTWVRYSSTADTWTGWTDLRDANTLGGKAPSAYVLTSSFQGNITVPVTLGTEDLDTIKSPGFYRQNANANTSVDRHYPELNAGTLMVMASAGVHQVYLVYNSSRIYTRAQYGTGAWTAWEKMPTNSDFESLKSLVSSGKTAIASAITAKGIAASGSETHAQLAAKIGQIKTPSNDTVFLDNVMKIFGINNSTSSGLKKTYISNTPTNYYMNVGDYLITDASRTSVPSLTRVASNMIYYDDNQAEGDDLIDIFRCITAGNISLQASGTIRYTWDVAIIKQADLLSYLGF